MLDARCPGCGLPIRIKEDVVDRRGRCSRCRAEFRFRDALIPGQLDKGIDSKTAATPAPARPRKAPVSSSRPAAWYEEYDWHSNQDKSSSAQPTSGSRESDRTSEESPWSDPPLANPPLLPPTPKRKKTRKSGRTGWSWWAGGGGVSVAVLYFIVRFVYVFSRQFGDARDHANGKNSFDVGKWVTSQPLSEARQAFHTKLTRKTVSRSAVLAPPANLFHVVEYDSNVGKLAAYLTPDPGDGQKRPAIIWIHGGDCSSIEDVWSEQPPDNDQTAAAFRKTGIVMMFPSLRGGNTNPGYHEAFFGEVEDVLSAADFLARQPHVDPKRIYLGGHSTGGTLALLVAESRDRFRAVFSFGPAESVTGHAQGRLPFKADDGQEIAIRSPAVWLHSIRSPVFVMEGEMKGTSTACGRWPIWRSRRTVTRPIFSG